MESEESAERATNIWRKFTKKTTKNTTNKQLKSLISFFILQCINLTTCLLNLLFSRLTYSSYLLHPFDGNKPWHILAHTLGKRKIAQTSERAKLFGVRFCSPGQNCERRVSESLSFKSKRWTAVCRLQAKRPKNPSWEWQILKETTKAEPFKMYCHGLNASPAWGRDIQRWCDMNDVQQVSRVYWKFLNFERESSNARLRLPSLHRIWFQQLGLYSFKSDTFSADFVKHKTTNWQTATKVQCKVQRNSTYLVPLKDSNQQGRSMRQNVTSQDDKSSIVILRRHEQMPQSSDGASALKISLKPRDQWRFSKCGFRKRFLMCAASYSRQAPLEQSSGLLGGNP